MNVSFAPEARLELFRAAAYYEEARAGLGCDFLQAIRDAERVVTAHPLRWPPRIGKARQYRLRRVREVREGKAELIDGEEVFAAINAYLVARRDSKRSEGRQS